MVAGVQVLTEKGRHVRVNGFSTIKEKGFRKGTQKTGMFYL